MKVVVHSTINCYNEQKILSIYLILILLLPTFQGPSLKMTRCGHTTWLELWQGEAGPLLSHGWRLPQIAEELPNASEQSPQITFLLGRHLKNKALHTLCGGKHRVRKENDAVNIRVDNRTINALHPRLFADSDPTNQSPKAIHSSTAGSIGCHEDHVVSVGELPHDCALYDAILARLLFMFVDVICIFADDVGGLRSVKKMLSTWIRIGSASSLSRSVRPKVIIVLSNHTIEDATADLVDETDFFFNFKQPTLICLISFRM